MSVIIDAHVAPRSWRGFDSPGMPIGTWIGHNALIGDATGGTMTIQFVFKEEGQAVTGLFYSIEQFDIFTTSHLNTFGGIRVLGFEQTPFIIGERHGHFFLDPTGPVFSGGHSFPTTPYFVGQSHFLRSGGSFVTVTLTNQNITVLSAVLMGYIWEPRSILAEGGLQHPTTALWGTGKG